MSVEDRFATTLPSGSIWIFLMTICCACSSVSSTCSSSMRVITRVTAALMTSKMTPISVEYRSVRRKRRDMGFRIVACRFLFLEIGAGSRDFPSEHIRLHVQYGSGGSHLHLQVSGADSGCRLPTRCFRRQNHSP